MRSNVGALKKLKIHFLILLFLSTYISCQLPKTTANTFAPKPVNAEKKSQNTEKEIPYIIAKRYFVKNNFIQKNENFFKILNQEKFDEIYGAAAVMGKDGMPTPIDFSKQFVVAIVGKETDLNTLYIPNRLTYQNNQITFRYEIQESEKQSFTIIPSLLILIDKKFNYNLEVEAFQIK